MYQMSFSDFILFYNSKNRHLEFLNLSPDLDNMYNRAVGRSEYRGISHLLRQACIICMYCDRSFMHYKSKTQAPRLYCVYSGLLSVHKLHFLADAYLSSLEFAPCARSKWARLLLDGHFELGLF